jgi:large subunit ribosomal protein L10
VQYVVIKNTLALRAVNESGLAGGTLKGPTGVVVSKDPAAAAKVLVDFAKENEQRPKVKGGLVDGETVNEADVKKLATLPTRDVAYGMLAGAMNGVLMVFALALDARKEQLENAVRNPGGSDGRRRSERLWNCVRTIPASPGHVMEKTDNG